MRTSDLSLFNPVSALFSSFQAVSHRTKRNKYKKNEKYAGVPQAKQFKVDIPINLAQLCGI